jgi:hypothetical protein
LINCPQGHIYSAVYEHCPYCPQPASAQDEDFITRVEEPITAVDPPKQAPYVPVSQGDFVTRVESSETLFETSETPVIVPPAPPPAFNPTEFITNASSVEGIGRANAELFEHPEPAMQPGADEILSEPLQTAPPQAEPVKLHESDRRTIVMADQAPQLRKTKGRIVGWLITYSHNPDGEDFRLYAGYNRLGANPVCDIVVEDETVSGSHAIIVYRDGRCLIKDDLSRNGTFVNGREITESHQLQSYDQIRVGNTYLTFVAAQRTS